MQARLGPLPRVRSEPHAHYISMYRLQGALMVRAVGARGRSRGPPRGGLPSLRRRKEAVRAFPLDGRGPHPDSAGASPRAPLSRLRRRAIRAVEAAAAPRRAASRGPRRPASWSAAGGAMGRRRARRRGTGSWSREPRMKGSVAEAGVSMGGLAPLPATDDGDAILTALCVVRAALSSFAGAKAARAPGDAGCSDNPRGGETKPPLPGITSSRPMRRNSRESACEMPCRI